MSRVQPYPYGALPAVSRADLWARRAVQSRIGNIDRTRVETAWRAVMNVPLVLGARGARVRPAAIGTPGDVGILLGVPGAELDRAVLLEVEGALAAAAVASALRGRAPVVYDTTMVPSARVIGAAAAVVLAVLRRVADEPIQVLASGPAHALAADLHRRAGSLATWQATVELEGTRYELRLTSMAHVIDTPPHARWSSLATPLTVPLVIARLELDRAMLAELVVGDALTLPDVTLGEPRTAWLATGASEHGVRVTLAKGTVVYGGQAEALPWSGESPRGDEMSESFQESLGDVPVVVRVEVGSVQLAANRWADLVPGDTLTLAQRVGAPVILRVSGVEVAQGELVQVEGELGVRITKRLDLPGEITHAARPPG